MALARFLSAYRDRNMLVLLYIGFASGLPFLLTLSTLSAWLSQADVDIKTIGLFALVGLPYSLKFLWAPFKDALHVPILTHYLGHRLAWLFATQLCLAAAIYAMGMIDPKTQLWGLAFAAVMVTFLSASQDIVSDAYRIELQEKVENMGAGAAVHSLGYRIGMLIAGAGALYLALEFPWPVVYQIISGIMVLCALGCFLCPKSRSDVLRQNAPVLKIRDSVIEPLRDFSSRSGWQVILLFVLCFKLGDSLATSLATPFYLHLQFTYAEIATITKIFGPAIFLLGGFLGGELVRRRGVFSALWIGGIAQFIGIFPFAILAAAGRDIGLLTFAIGAENFTSGMGSAAFVAYLSGLCNLRYTASQYAILSSIMALGRTLLSSSMGFVVVWTGWVWFFVLTAMMAIPGLILLRHLMRLESGKKADGLVGA
jgi:PAT family beta-lactamase induction signal transducer AmpG